MTVANAINAQQTGVQCQTSTGVWNGRTITAGTGISVANGDGVSGNPTVSWTGSSTPSPSTVFSFYDDFCMAGSILNGSSLPSSEGWKVITETGSTSGATWGMGAADSTHIGIINITCDDTVSRAIVNGPAGSVSTSPTHIVLGGGVFTFEALIKLSALSVTNQVYIFRAGIGNILEADIEPTNGVFLTYTSTINSGNWVGKTISSSSPTSVSSSTAVTTNWTKIAFTVNAAASSVEFFINGVSIGSTGSTIPTAAMGYFFNMVAVSGGNNKTLSVDYVTSTLTFTTPR